MSWTFDNGTIMTKAALLGNLENNVFVVACAQTGKGVIIDAATEPGRILELADGVEITAVLTTHGHPDHVMAVKEITQALDVPFFLHPDDNWLAVRHCPDVPPSPLTDEQVIVIGETSLLAIHTPGHTPGSMCFLSPGVLFSGDTLFPGGPGKTTFERGDFDTIIKSIRERLFPLGDETDVYPGHGPTKTTIGDERPSLPEWVARGW